MWKTKWNQLSPFSRQGETKKRKPFPRQQRQDRHHLHQSLPVATLSWIGKLKFISNNWVFILKRNANLSTRTQLIGLELDCKCLFEVSQLMPKWLQDKVERCRCFRQGGYAINITLMSVSDIFIVVIILIFLQAQTFPFF